MLFSQYYLEYVSSDFWHEQCLITYDASGTRAVNSYLHRVHEKTAPLYTLP